VSGGRWIRTECGRKRGRDYPDRSRDGGWTFVVSFVERREGVDEREGAGEENGWI
jgi:hypothetical protein